MFVNHKLYKSILVVSGVVIAAGYGLAVYIQPEDPAFLLITTHCRRVIPTAISHFRSLCGT
ncbi:hypothetical protein [Alkalibacterium pelagium]|uniref:Uncharacterized protein n=1 Tax=Alkalibacterium pelagium TaxID=426702 RepID=A0A1H7PJ12_9LACT|nr:hypothetical protein [Alkalibacterium pelagium]GEN51654.1 hypothetical protein APE02nite_23190 [Alkalibacterium pelagium]SEL35760.1 hypothetical protein SAMN04488099_12115 [Alkalibacterium pelagium]